MVAGATTARKTNSMPRRLPKPGLLIRRALDLRAALNLGIHIGLDEIRGRRVLRDADPRRRAGPVGSRADEHPWQITTRSNWSSPSRWTRRTSPSRASTRTCQASKPPPRSRRAPPRRGIDGMTASMVKGATAGNLLADAIKKAIEFAKEWTIEAAKEAAHAERAVAITRTLAKAHGDGAAAAQKAIEAIRKVGFAAADATTSVQKLIIADIGLDKATSLAKIAKDAAAVNTEGLDASAGVREAHAGDRDGPVAWPPDDEPLPQDGRGRGGRAVAGATARQDALRPGGEAGPVQRHRGGVEDDPGVRCGSRRHVRRPDEEALPRDEGSEGGRGQGVPGRVDGGRRPPEGHRVGFFRDHTDAIEKFGKGTLVLVGIIATITAATKAWALAQGALNLAMAINPAFLLAGGIIGAGAIIYKEYSDMKEGMDARYKQMETDALRKDVGSGKVKIDDLRKRGMTDDQIRELISGRKLDPGRVLRRVRHRRQAQDRRHRQARSGGVEARHRGSEAPEGERAVLQGPVHRRQWRGQDRVREGRCGDERGDRAAHHVHGRQGHASGRAHQVGVGLDHRHDAEEVPGVQGPLRAGEQEDPRGLPQGRGREAPEGDGVRGASDTRSVSRTTWISRRRTSTICGRCTPSRSSGRASSGTRACGRWRAWTP